jgi:hypothetical protein
MTTWSITPFFNELDVLELRLATIDSYVDRHILIEADTTQTGIPKPLSYAEHHERFAAWDDRIHHVVVRDMPGTSWEREAFQRNAAADYAAMMEPDDLVFLSDVDEIPAESAFERACPAEVGPQWVGMAMHLYKLNWRWEERPVMSGTRATFVTGDQFLRTPASELVEQHTNLMRGDNGWHLAYQGDTAAILTKLAAIADGESGWLHQGFGWKDRWTTADHVSYCVETGHDLFDRPHRQSEWIPDSELPVWSRHPWFDHMKIPEPERQAA